jgi:hypothetical protein
MRDKHKVRGEERGAGRGDRMMSSSDTVFILVLLLVLVTILRQVLVLVMIAVGERVS